MPNNTKNKIEFICDKETMSKIFKKYNTHFPEEFRRSRDGSIVCEKDNNDVNRLNDIGWFNDKTGIFTTKEREEITGLPEGFVRKIKPAFDHFPDFNKIIPQPDNIFIGDLGRQEEEMCKREGLVTWYRWNIDNWETKWNSYCCEKIDDNIYMFETAWNRVEKIIEKMSIDFPEVKIIYKYADEDSGYNCGILIFENGVKTSEIIPENKSIEAYELLFELRPNYRDYYILKDGEYVFVDEDEG